MRFCGVLATMAAVLLIARPASAGDCAQAPSGGPDCCAQCGCKAACQKKVCQVVCDKKKEKKTRWVVKCEEFCAPLPSLIGRGCGECGDCGACETSQGDAGCATCAQSGQCCPTCKEKKLVPPKCGKVRTKKTLVKEEYEVEVPAYKCVVVYLCGQCCEAGAAGAGAGCAAETGKAPAAGPTPAPAPKPATAVPPAPKAARTY